MITSTRNPKIKWLRALTARRRARQKEGLFVIEGVRLAEEALNAGWPAKMVLYTEALNERGQALVRAYAAQGTSLEIAQEHVMQAASDTDTPQGILVVLELREQTPPDSPHFVFIPDRVRDPGNLGTMLRTASAAGVEAVLLPPETVDPFSPKVLRAGMGAHFRLPLVSLSWEEIGARLQDKQIYLAAAGAGIPYTQADFRSPLALVIGGEADGASAQAQQFATRRVHIPMPGGSESLNAAIAAGILLFEAARQRADKSTSQ